MKWFFSSISIFGFLTSVFAQSPATEEKEIHSQVFDTLRQITIYLPPAYHTEPDRKFEVLYVFDAQRKEVFNTVVSIASYLTENDANPMIIVGIKSNNRWDEFLPVVNDTETRSQIEGFFGTNFKYGNAEKLIQHLKSEIFPFIERNYRTLSTRIALGHSFGATFLSYATVKYPEMFDASINISPNLVFDKENMIAIIGNFKNTEPPLKAYNYIAYGRQGDYETSFYEATQKAIGLYTAQVADGYLFSSKEFSEANHSNILPYGITAGLSDYYNTIFLNGHNAVAYYANLELNKEVTLTAEQILMLAQNCYLNGKTDDAIIISEWAAKKYPDNDSIYRSIAEIELNRGNKIKSKQYYEKALAVVKSKKKSLDAKLYNEKLAYYKNSLKKFE